MTPAWLQTFSSRENKRDVSCKDVKSDFSFVSESPEADELVVRVCRGLSTRGRLRAAADEGQFEPQFSTSPFKTEIRDPNPEGSVPSGSRSLRFCWCKLSLSGRSGSWKFKNQNICNLFSSRRRVTSCRLGPSQPPVRFDAGVLIRPLSLGRLHQYAAGAEPLILLTGPC